MKGYETRTANQEHCVSTVCDGCGVVVYYSVTVVISVNEDEEGGQRDEYDFCDDCLLERADALVAAGSRAPLVNGEETPDA